MQVIQAETRRGKGTGDDPVRMITQYWTVDGEFLAEELDPYITVSDESKPSRPRPPKRVTRPP